MSKDPVALPPARYECGGDEFVFVELDQAMSLEANFKAMAITAELRERALDGVVDICPSNASYLIRVDPERLHPKDLIDELTGIDERTAELPPGREMRTRIVDVPVWFNDPWTHETLMHFREHHQDPEVTDLEYAARGNGLAGPDELIEALSGSPFLVTMIGFVPGLPFCYQLVPRERQIEVPKYVRPRTDTPERTFGHGGAFSVVYPVRGAGGYQMFGISAAPVFDGKQRLPDFAEGIVFPRPGDILRYRSIDRSEYDEVRARVEAGTFRYRIREVDVAPSSVLADPDSVNRELLEVLYR